jgi:Ca2+ transporting ATPase
VEEWWTVLKISMPVIFLDETLKLVARKYIDGNKNKTEYVILLASWLAFFWLISVV